jgi:hypothetical protein
LVRSGVVDPVILSTAIRVGEDLVGFIEFSDPLLVYRSAGYIGVVKLGEAAIDAFDGLLVSVGPDSQKLVVVPPVSGHPNADGQGQVKTDHLR